MRKEIDILVRAAGKRCAVVDKASHEFWTSEMLCEAREAGLFQDETDLFPPDRQTELAGPLPGLAAVVRPGPEIAPGPGHSEALRSSCQVWHYEAGIRRP